MIYLAMIALAATFIIYQIRVSFTARNAKKELRKLQEKEEEKS